MPPKKKIGRNTPVLGRPQLTFTEQKRLFKARSTEYTIKGIFKYGYRNKEDISNLPSETLVVGSQNVLTNAAEQVGIRNGYQLDGSGGNQNTYGIDSSFDFNTHSIAGIQNVRKWGTNLEVRYVNPVTGAVSWINLMSILSATNVCNFTEFWDNNTELINFLLFVNGNNSVYEWSGGVGSFASATSNTITLQGTGSLTSRNFYKSSANSAKMQLLIDGVVYKYTGAGNASSVAFSQAPINNQSNIDSSNWYSQKFTTGASAQYISTVTAQFNNVAISVNSANFVAGIYTDNAGVPGTLVGSISNSSIAGGFSAGTWSVSFTFNEVINPATNYHLVVYCSNSAVQMTANTGNSSGVGTNHSADGGVTWSGINGYLYCTVNEIDSSIVSFTGVTPNPVAAGISVGDAVIQVPVVGTAALNSAPLTEIDLIATLRNQVYYGSFINQNVYISKVNTYSDCSFSTPRVVGEGANVVLDAPPVGFKALQNTMTMSAGRNFMYQTKFTLSSDLTKESFEINRLKTSSSQGAQAQSLMAEFKNSMISISYEPILNALGPVKNILADVQMVNMSDPIKYDMDAYNFAGGHIYYFKYFIYFSVPKQGVVRIYNVQKKYWEAPQVIPVSFFYEVNGVLCGHSALTNESYQLFVPGVYRDGGVATDGTTGNPISAVAAFPYVSAVGGAPFEKKSFNKHYTEGYIAGNTSLNLTINYDFGGYNGNYSAIISGANKRIIFNKVTDGSLGQNSLGTEPLGTILNLPNTPAIPKFRQVSTFPRVNCYEYQLVYSTNDIDQNWSLLRLGPAVSAAPDLPTEISV